MKIAGGNNTTVTAFPFAVHLLYDEINTCTGSIIGDRWILTAAHCVVAVKESEEAGKIILNDPSKYGINIGLNSNINNNLVIPKKIYAHPKYNGTTISHDVGLLELRRPLKFTNAIQSVKLINDTSKLSVDQMFTAIGWGRDQTQKLTPKLNRVDLPNGSTEFCTEVNPDYPLYSDQLLCTEDVPGKDTCLGDSGGPLLVEIANSNSTVGEKAAAAWLQAGVTSFGHNLLDKIQKFVV
ncbi:trypsin-like cysteine/serine peptidase domain-containing protein [Syncephalis fuscata]|nr:trypsin-like cysteine/serine peptidase domain-containing protein [Syncephalis fuscata]